MVPAGRARALSVFGCVFLPFALGHYLSSLLRTVNAVLAPTLMRELALSPAQLGLLTSVLFLSFALAQLPVGWLLDHFGPRKVQLVLMLVAALGAALFAHGRSMELLLLARALIGVGLAGCFMSALKAISAAVAPHRLPSVNGYLIAVGGLGAASATLPVRMALQLAGWRGVFEGLAVMAAAIGLLIWAVAPRSAPLAPGATLPGSVVGVYRTARFRRVAGLVLLPHAVFFGVQGLWIGRWLADVGGYGEAAVAYLLYLAMAAVIFGAIAVGMLTEWAGRRGVAPLDVAAAGIGAFVLVQCAMAAGYAPSLRLLSVLFTLVGTITGIEYALLAQGMPPTLTGRAATALNLLIFVAAFLVQAGFGLVLGLWVPDAPGHYPPAAYRAAFGAAIALQLPGLLIYFLRRPPVECGHYPPARKEDDETAPLRTPR